MTDDRTTTYFAEFETALVSSAEGLFATLKQPARVVRRCEGPPPVSDRDSVVTTLGFGGDHVRGNVIIATALKAAGPLCPSILGDVDEFTVCDNFGEVGNMLLGRLKNELLRLGVTLHIGLPTTTVIPFGRGHHSTPGAMWHVFELPAGPCYVRIAVSFDSEFAFARDADKVAPIGVEGEAFFF